MGIFSLFGKKDQQPASKPADQAPSRRKLDEGGIRRNTDAVQRKAAQATALKIDAIESEMSSEFVRPLGGNTRTGPPSQFLNTTAQPFDAPATALQKRQESAPLAVQTILPDILSSSTAFLLSPETVGGPVAISRSEAAPVIEEAAILYANGQNDMVEQLLLNAIRDEALGNTPLMVWGMLFDLYQATGQRAPFDNLSIEYANRFEMSPPAWIEAAAAESPAAPTRRAGTTPAVSFSGKLDAGIVKHLERVNNLADKSRVLRLEFTRVTEVGPVGCGLLLSVLKKLQKSGHDLILVGAPELAEKIRAILRVGRRDETEAPWLLLLELLRLLNRETDFEEASIDYCVTFEVSPPAFVAPQNKITMAAEDSAGPAASADLFMMPAVIDARTDQLIQAITAYAEEHDPAILDCSRLTRIDFSAAGQLLAGLMPLTGSGKTVKLHNVNHLVAALCNVMGLKDIVHIVPRRN